MEETAYHRDALPGLLRRIAEVAGLGAALAISRALGGRDVYVARNPRPTSPLAQVVGVGLARRIAAEIGHGSYRVPHAPTEAVCAARLRVERRYEELVARGASVAEIAHATGLSRRTVERRRARARRRVCGASG